MTLAFVLLAAGRSRRMRGGDKLLEEVDGEPLLSRQAKRAIAAGIGCVAVTFPVDSPSRVAALEGLAVTRIPVADADEGLAASLRAAASWAEGIGATGLMLCPADLPDLTANDFASIAASFEPGGAPLRATADNGAPGHPVVFPARLFAEFAALSGDTGARPILDRHPPRFLKLPSAHATTDLDTPEDWLRWRAGHSKSTVQ